MRTFFTLVALLVSAGQPAAPALPQLQIDAYPSAAREAIARAYGEAMLRPREPQAVGALGRVLHAWEQWQPAADAYARAEALAPGTLDWPYLRALVLQRIGRRADALVELKAALSDSPSYLPARVKLAEVMLDAGDFDASERAFKQLTEPSCAPSVEFGLGRIAASRQRHEEAITHFERATALFPEFGAAYYSAALSYRAMGRIDAARAALEKHEKYGARWPAIDDPIAASVSALREDAAALVKRGIARADAGDLDGAIAAHEAALAMTPSFAQAHAHLISLYGRQKNWAKAEEHYRALVALGEGLADAHYDYGVLLGLQNRWTEAADAYRKAVALNPMHAQAHNNLGQILERDRGFADALAEYRIAVESQPKLRVARFNLGRMLIALGQNDEAIAELAQLTEPRDAEAPVYLFGLATAHVRAGHRQDGIKWATEARDLALHFGDTGLAAAIDRELAGIK